MKNIIAALIATVALSGCVVYPAQYAVVTHYEDDTTTVVYEYEPDVWMNGHYIGYFQPAFGYWTGYGWDISFYAYGHPGCGHFYHGAPREAWGYYHYRPIPSYAHPYYNSRPVYNDRTHSDHTRSYRHH